MLDCVQGAPYVPILGLPVSLPHFSCKLGNLHNHEIIIIYIIIFNLCSVRDVLQMNTCRAGHVCPLNSAGELLDRFGLNLV
jgi:hypothetical protein